MYIEECTYIVHIVQMYIHTLYMLLLIIGRNYNASQPFKTDKSCSIIINQISKVFYIKSNIQGQLYIRDSRPIMFYPDFSEKYEGIQHLNIPRKLKIIYLDLII